MKGFRHNVRNSDDLARLFYRLGECPHPFRVTVAIGEESRTSQQNRLLHRWFADIERQTEGQTAVEIKAQCNLTYGRPILARDDLEWSACFGYLFDALPYDAKLRAIRLLDVPFTRRMGVKQLTEYMDQMQRDYTEQGVRLTDPEALKYAAEFGE